MGIPQLKRGADGKICIDEARQRAVRGPPNSSCPCTSVIYTKMSNFILKKSKRELPQDPAIPLLDIHPKDLKQGLEEIFAHPRSRQHSSQEPKGGRGTSVHPQVNGYAKCGPPIRWNITQPLKKEEIPTHVATRMNLKDVYAK